MGLHEFLTTSTAVKTAFWILSNTQTGMNKLHKTSTVVKTCLHELYKTSTVLKKTAFKVLHTDCGKCLLDPNTQTGLHKLFRTPTVVKTAIRSLLTAKQVCTSFAGPPQR